MSKPIKDMVTADYRRRYAGFTDMCVVDVTRLDVKSVTSLRAGLLAKDIELHVVKNSLARRAFEGTALEPIGDSLGGPCALVTGGDSIIDVAKALAEATKEFEQFELKHGMLQGDPELMPVAEMAKLKGRLELIAEVAGLAGSPGRALSGCLRSPGARIAGCLKARVEEAA